MSALVLALASSLAWGAADFTGGLMSRRLPLSNVLVLSQIAGLTGLVIAVAIQGDSPPFGHYALLAALSGLGGGLGLTCFYRALAIGNMAIVAPISATAAVIPVAVGLVGGDVDRFIRSQQLRLRSSCCTSARTGSRQSAWLRRWSASC